MAMAMHQRMGNRGEIKCTQCGAGLDMARASEHVCRSAPTAAAPMDPMARFNNALANMKIKTSAPFPFDARPGPSLPARNDPIAASRMQAREDSQPLQPSALPPSNPPPQSARIPPPQTQKAPFRMPPRQMTAPEAPQRMRLPWEASPSDMAPPRGMPPRGNPPQQPGSFQHPPPGDAGPMEQNALFARPPPRSATPGAQRTQPPVQPAQPEWPPHQLGLPPGLQPLPDIERAATATPTMSGRRGPHGPSPNIPGNPMAAAPGGGPGANWGTDYSAGEPLETRKASPQPRYHDRSEDPLPSSATTIHPPRLDSAPGNADVGTSSTPPSPPRPQETAQEQAQSSAKLGHFRKPSMSAAIRPLHEIGSLRHRATPSRSGSVPPSADEERSDSRLQDAPPVPNATFPRQKEEIRRSRSVPGIRDEASDPHPLPLFHQVRQNLDEDLYHSPTQSVSSTGSANNTSSSRSSPPTSAASLAPYRSQPEADQGKPFEEPVRASYKTRAPPPLKIAPGTGDLVPPPLSARSAPHNDRQLPYSPSYDMPPLTAPLKQGFDEPVRAPEPEMYPKPDQGPEIPPRRRPVQSFSRPRFSRPMAVVEPESPLDPDMHFGRLPAADTRARPPPPPPQLRQWETAPTTPRMAPPDPLALSRPQFPPRGESRSQPTSPPQPTRQPSRHTCRGCNEVIRGKSVSSADGRLTGRWHRSCFVCRTCAAPFATQDFYVFGNQPYCAHHYHALARTLCAGCNMGIEGSYIETDRHLKFHPDCFCCAECAGSLAHTHYEDPQSGHIMCERCAFETSMRPGVHGERSYPERRTTRMMTMF